MPDIAFYLEFVLKLFFAFGVAFEIPIATILLVAIGATTPENLAKKRPYVIVGVFIAGMLLTPPDVVSQTLLALPMWLLFEAGILFSRFFQRGRGTASDGAADAPDPASPRPPTPPQPAPSGAPAAAGNSGGDVVVGRDIDGGDIDEPGRFRPMTDEEMEAELDAIEAQELAEAERSVAADPVAELLRQANVLRGEGNPTGARHLLYRVLEDGDSDQRRVARNILADLDKD
jgi:sec-independent protein translocase protein TatC